MSRSSFQGQPSKGGSISYLKSQNRARMLPKINPGLWTPKPRLCGQDSISCQVKGGFQMSLGQVTVGVDLGAQQLVCNVSPSAKWAKRKGAASQRKHRKYSHYHLQPLWILWTWRGLKSFRRYRISSYDGSV